MPFAVVARWLPIVSLLLAAGSARAASTVHIDPGTGAFVPPPREPVAPAARSAAVAQRLDEHAGPHGGVIVRLDASAYAHAGATAAPATAARFTVVSADGPGEGFGDATPVVPSGGNPATTRGAARLRALEHAAAAWSGALASAAEVRISARFDALVCGPTSARLGSAGPGTVLRDFPGAPRANTWYPQALANALAGVDLDPDGADVVATFNAALDDGACLGGVTFYYGLDAKPPAGTIDFVTVALHELAHGLGFGSPMSVSSGARLNGLDDVYLTLVERHGAQPAPLSSMDDAGRAAAVISDPQLHWLGPALNQWAPGKLSAGVGQGAHVRLHGPPTAQPGVSLVHVTSDASPNTLMEPSHMGPNHDLGLALALLTDLGWQRRAAQVPGLPLPPTLALGLLLAGVGAWLASRRDR